MKQISFFALEDEQMLMGIIKVLAVLCGIGLCAYSGLSPVNWLWIFPVGAAASLAVLILLALLFVYICCAGVDTEKPQLHDSPFYRRLAILYAGFACAVLRVRLHRKGIEKLPRDGRFLLICNHLNEMDPVSLIDTFPNAQLAFISKRENNSMPVIGKLMHKIMCQLLNRENDREALKVILRCVQLLKDDEVNVALFPEGYIHGDNKLHKFRAGSLKIAIKANVPIVVCTIAGSQDSFRNALRMKPTDVKLHLVEVIQPEFYKGKTAVQIAEYCYQVMLADLGPAYAMPEQVQD